ncbi:MAG TPA: pyridoxal phosphate-dependent aminotransferase [Ktedonobacterales bacterium]
MSQTEPSFPPIDTAAPLSDSASANAGAPSRRRSSRGSAATVTHPPRATPPSRQRSSRAKSQHNGHQDPYATITALRHEICPRFRTEVAGGAAPIRVMATMVRELQAQCRALGLPEDVMATEIVNRTIGDVDLRAVSPTDDGPEFVSLADDMGLALPGEVIGGRVSAGARYREIREKMLDFERQLLARRWDMRMYDILGVGNPLLREMLHDFGESRWGYAPPVAQTFVSLGALDGLDKFFRGYQMVRRAAGDQQLAVAFPAPGFNVPEWQAKSLGYRLHRLYTRPEDAFKVTPAMLQAALDEAPDLRAFYLTVSNNPTAFSYSPDELRALLDVVARADRELRVVADLAYVGTGDPAADRARMAEFNRPSVLERTVFVWSLSKTHTLTGDRCGWVVFGDAKLASALTVGWANTIASLPADWQLRFMADLALFAEHPELQERIRALYRHRRERLVKQLERLDAKHHVFARVNLDDGGTVYNWSQLRPGQDVFTLFSTTGIAGVPGGAFGYSDDFVRLSVGCIPIPAV